MGFFSKLFKGPEIDMEKSRRNAEKMRLLFNQAVENGDTYRLIFGYTEDVSRFNYGFVHGSRTKIGNLIVGWNEDSQTIAVVPTVPDLSGCGTPVCYRRSEILKAYRNKYPTDAFIIYPDKKGYIGINAYDWLVCVCGAGGGAGRLHRVLYEPVCGEGWEKITCDRSVMQRSGQGDAWLGGYDIFLCCQEKTLDINLPGIQEISLLPAFEK